MGSPSLELGQNIRVVQTVETREGPWRTEVVGKVVSFLPQSTGSWFAHGRHDKLWLQRLRLLRPDGELIDLIVDAATEVTSMPA